MPGNGGSRRREEAGAFGVNGKREKSGRGPGRDEGGFTLLETLAALLLVGMVASILYGFLLLGMSTFQRVATETQIRHQGDLLVAGIVAELMEAVHVEQGADAAELIAVRMAADPARYVETYRLRIEALDGRHGVSVYREGAPLPERRFALAAGMALEEPGTRSVLLADGSRAAVIRMDVVQLEGTGRKADEARLIIDTRLALTRLE